VSHDHATDPLVVAQPPTAADLAGWAKVDPAEPLLADAVDAALTGQAHRCVTVPYAADLRLAALRRGARYLQSRQVPLGILVGEYGSEQLRRFDAVTDELEGPYVRVVIA
jgi:hypothetical protein